jgi:hypothetical protein
MVDKEEAVQRIIDMYDFYGFLQLVFSDDDLAEEIIEITEVDDALPETEE